MAGLAARRTADLLHWDLSAPHHRACHPREDHLVPIYVAVCAVEDDVTMRTYHDKGLFGGVTMFSYLLG